MQKTNFFKRIMTLFLAFVMVLGILPLSSMVVPAQALMDVSGGMGDPPATITNNSHQTWGSYESPTLKPSKVIPRIFDFNVGDGVSPGFCADHSKDIAWNETWSSPQSIFGTKYEVIMPLLAAYCQKWFYSRMLDEQHPDWSVTQKKNQAKEDLGSQHYYYTEEERITGSAMVQAAAWLAGADMLSSLSDHDQQMLIAQERNLTMKATNGFVTETDEEVAQWVANSVAAYAEGEYGQWKAYIYYPGRDLQPIITVIPPDGKPIPDNGWIKIKKTDLSGNNLAGATFGIYLDSGCQEGAEIDSFTTTGDEWTYYDVSELMDSATQTFYLKEISAPKGYVASSKSYSVTVSSTNNSTQETAAAVNGGAPIKNGDPQPPEGVVNKVDQDGNGIGPATFHFKSLTNSVDADFETDENGELQFQWTDPNGENYIQPGEYTVTEEIAPPGYEKSDEAQNLRLWIEDIDGVPTPMHSGPIVFENKPLHSVIIQKVDESGNGLPGAVFEVYCNGALVTNITTGADGTFTFAGTDGNGLTNGTWEFVEVKAPDGHLLPYNKVQRVTINTEHDDVLIHELTFVNYTYPEIVIKKVAAGEEQPLAGAVFEVMIDGTNIGTYGPTGPDGTIVINHDVYGKFLENDNQDTWTVGVREVVAPDGYLIDDPDWQFAEIHRGTELQPFVFTDTKYPEIHILKRDRDTGDPVAGTSFRVEINGVDIGTVVTEDDGVATITYEDYKRFLGDINGDEVSQDGWGVTVTEVEVTPGYNKDLQPESGDFSITKHLQPNQSVLEFVFEDTPYRDLLIRKYDSTNSWLLQGAHFYLESITLENPEAAGPDGVVTADGVTNENGELLFEDLPNGTYKLTEITPPTGYDLADPHEWEVVISSNSKPVVLVEAENHPREGLLITKHDAITNKPLANVEFTVRYLGDGNETTDTSNEARPYMTDENGVIYIPDIVPGWYEIRETRVPDGYVIDPEPRLIEVVNNHGSISVPFYNYQDTQLIILKKDNQTGEPLPGARFVITTAGGSVINANLVTGANGYATLNGLEPGSYVVREVEAPDGHLIDSTPQTFEIRVGQTEPVFLVFGNDGETTLYIRKEDAQTRLPVAGAVFQLRKTTGEIIRERLETGLDGLASLDGLEPGSYIVEEIEAPPGYLLAEEPEQIVNLEAGETEMVLFRNNKPGGIAILKQDAISGLPLEGAVFEVTRPDGSLVGNTRYTTGKDGYIRISDLESGYYIVQEVEAPEGYLLDSTKHQVYVEDFKVTLIELDNYEQASFVVEKIDAESKIPLAGAEFGLFTMSGEQIGDPFITDQSGKASLTGIEPGWYIVKELTAPLGYVLNTEEFRVQIVEGQPTTLTVPNTPESGITVRKVDATTRDPLPGAEFELRTYDGKLLGNYTTDASGSFVTVNVEPGVYYLVETRAPDGYTIVEERTEVEVADGEKPVVTIENHKNTSIQIQKMDSITGAYLEGAEFEVREFATNRVVAVCTTDRAGIAVTEPLPVGDYIVVETKAPKGYVLDETHHHVEVQYDTPAILRVSNVPLTGIMITKLSTVDDEPLMGAKFTIRTAEGRELGEVTTDTTGTATFPVTEPGVYWVQEVEQPDGYLLDDTVHRVEVVAGEMAPLVVENAPEASLVIFKGDADTGRGVAGAIFEVEHVDGAFIGRYTTDAQGEALIRPIEPGHYIVREVGAPDGYELPNVTEKTVTVLAGRINRVVFEDLAYGSLIVRLEDGADGSPLANGRFQLFWAATGEMIQEGVTANDGTIHWGDLPTGDYIIRQTYAPDGYTMTETEIRETVVSNETRTVVFQNVTAGIVIEKLDRTNSDPLSGARFQVTRDEDNIVIGEYVTDEDGLALVGGLTPGMYTVEEIVAPEGYELDSEAQTVHVKASEFAHATFTDTPFAGITVNTVDQSNSPLAGVVIEIYRQNGELINTWTTDNTGIIQTEKLTSGYYVIKVIKNPDGYTPVTTETTVQIKDGVNANVRLVFNAGGTLNIYALNGDEVGLAGMQVEVTTINGTRVGTYTTDATGIIKVPGLNAGWYVVTVTKAPDGYTINEVNQSQNVEVTSDGTAEVKFRFGQTYGVQIRTSVEQTGAMVPGVEYRITRLDGSIVGTYTSNDMGLVYVNLEPGWYVIEQTKLPAGYENYNLCEKRNVEVLADQPTIVDFVLTQLSSMRVKVVDGSTEAPIYGVKLILRDSAGTIIDEYTTNNEGYITLKNTLVDGTYTLTMSSVPDGYTADTIPKTVEVLNGQTTEIVWKLYNQAGQIQVHLTSSAYNPTLDLPAGSNLSGAVFEVYDPFTYAVLATIETDAYGVAASPGLPIGRYIIREKTAAPYFGLSGKETEVYIKINNDVVRVEYQAAPLNLKITHTVTGNANAAAGSFSKYLFTAVNNDSSSRLDNFFFNITIPTDAIRGGTLFTGKWSADVTYNISYKTNMNDYRVFATGLSSASSYQYDLSSLALDVQSGEYVTDVRFEFGTVPAGFKVTSSPVFYGYVMPTIPNSYIVIVRSEAGGQFSGVWKTESALCTTNVINNGGGSLPSTLPKTGY
ncbi:SpaA isopeptide-forming pilin-related protein [Pseudoflavonifractor phocaeensis]|uniref:SpaA isopeptide-forming pilin-related protein n=1 Tax=Pseudoflavonifractor phocaeensis TaxID=1870988 RepID=UPI00195A6302|nr:SpaA isopeptide-forming pilin-related protein [Pseudoflavonifractor phocaeensis]MBM6724002.1 hypothetical protein [Pseudoflavonifractor phocaeensis]